MTVQEAFEAYMDETLPGWKERIKLAQFSSTYAMMRIAFVVGWNAAKKEIK